MVQELKNNDNHCEYCCFNKDCHPLDIASICDLHNSFFVELKQTNEDMGENNGMQPYDELFSPGTVSNTKYLAKEDMEEKKINLKPFDIQKAREGKPVCTRNGKKARIICFDVKAKKPIAALITTDDTEEAHFYYDNGRSDQYQKYRYDLMMLPEKKEGWVNVYRDCDGANITKDDNIYSSKEAAMASAQVIDRDNYVATTIIKWEE